MNLITDRNKQWTCEHKPNLSTQTEKQGGKKNRTCKTKCQLGLIGVPEGDERENGAEKIYEDIMVKNFSKMTIDINPKMQRKHSYSQPAEY